MDPYMLRLDSEVRRPSELAGWTPTAVELNPVAVSVRPYSHESELTHLDFVGWVMRLEFLILRTPYRTTDAGEVVGRFGGIEIIAQNQYLGVARHGFTEKTQIPFDFAAALSITLI